MNSRPSVSKRVLSPVLLLGAGPGEATCGILYLASFLRRNGIEAFVRLTDADESAEALIRSLTALLNHVRPKLVGISLKWFHHLARAQFIAETLKAIDPTLRVVIGGNTASYYWKDIAKWTCLDDVLLGDGEAPLLAVARGYAQVPNVVSRSSAGIPNRAPLSYVQGTSHDDVYYSHFDELFLSQVDRHSFSGWVAPGKGCAENCVYCGGARGTQKASFGRAKPFLRAEESVQRDHREVAPRSWQFRYDFSGSSADFLQRAWSGVDLSQHSTTYFLWGVPPRDLVSTLSANFRRVFMVLDIGCFSQSQRLELISRGLLKPCPTDAELFEVIEHCRSHGNVELEVSGIAGLPFASKQTLKEESHLVDQVMAMGCLVGYQRLQSQPGALVTEHADRFAMRSEARNFDEFMAFFAGREIAVDTSLPMLRFTDEALESAVQVASEVTDAKMIAQVEAREHQSLRASTVLHDASASATVFSLGEWLGTFQAPKGWAGQPVHIIRAINGHGLACAPGIRSRQPVNPGVIQGDDARLLLSVLRAFEHPTSVAAAQAALRKQSVDANTSAEAISHLAAGHFLRQHQSGERTAHSFEKTRAKTSST